MAHTPASSQLKVIKTFVRFQRRRECNDFGHEACWLCEEMLQNMEQTKALDKSLHIHWTSLIFLGLHAACLLVFVVGVDWGALALCAGLFLVRKFGITAGYHRYFSHRSYKTSRFFQFCLACLGGSAGQKGALWWAAHHRHHHRHSDTELDVHSAKREGFYWSHIGWVLSREYTAYDAAQVKDFAKYPELVWLDKYYYVPPMLLAIACFLLHSWSGLVWGFFVSTVVLYHTTFAINSCCHLFGGQRYQTGESSRNSFWLALLTLGEGWHNNHHHYPLSARQGFFWWEIDLSYYGLKLLSWLRVIWDLQRPPARLLQKQPA
jgi:stearoyl-CoA desaturase (delta-9 desaturase)